MGSLGLVLLLISLMVRWRGAMAGIIGGGEDSE